MPDASFDFLTKFFSEHLPFTPTPGQVADFKSDLALVSPFLMEASLIEVKAGTLGNILVYRPNEWRAAIFKVYYRKVAEHAQLFPIFHSFETAFRSTVALQLEQHYSHKRWWRAVYEVMRKGDDPKTVTKVGGIKMTTRVAFLIGKIIQSNDMVAIDAFDNGYQFLECCSLAQTRELIERHWSTFSSLFHRANPPYTLADFTSKFDRVRKARNDVYHHKSLSGMSNIVATAEELLDHLNFSLGFVYEKIATISVIEPTFAITPEPRHRTW